MKTNKLILSIEDCKIESLKYNNPTDFKRNSNIHYNMCVRNKWLKEVCSHMTGGRKYKGYWSFEKCKETALKYIDKLSFNKNDNIAYNTSHKNGWLDQICNHMKPLGNKYKRCIYSYMFEDNSVYVGLTFNLNKRQNNRNNDKNDQVTKYIKQTGLIPIRTQLTDYIDLNDAIKLEEYYVNYYTKMGCFILNKNKTGGIGSTIKINWTKDKCFEESKKYKTRTEFKIKSCGAYYTSIDNNWLDDFFIKTNNNYPTKYWNYDNCKKISLSCKSRNDLNKKSRSAYNSSKRNGWLDEFYPKKIKYNEYFNRINK